MRQRSFSNSIGIAMTNALTASSSIHYAYCNAPNDEAKRHLVTAMHSTLIIAEQCRQEMKSWLEP